jgi:hypothetical protein
MCAQEVTHALADRKRIIPTVRETVAAPLAELNWIFFRPADDFTAALDTGLDYWRAASQAPPATAVR